MRGYTIYHQHSEHSIKDSPLGISDLIARAKEQNAGSVTLTDHGSMTGIIEFLSECGKEGINGIPGCELYVQTPYAEHAHLVAVAKNYTGYQDLCHLVSEGNKTLANIGGIQAPVVTLEQVKQYLADGNVILSSACVNGVLASILFYNERLEAEKEKLLRRRQACHDPNDPVYLENVRREQEYEKKIAELQEKKKTCDRSAKKSYRKRLSGLNAFEGEKREAMKRQLDAEMHETEQAQQLLPKLRTQLQSEKRKYSAVHAEVRKAAASHEKWETYTEKIGQVEQKIQPEEQLIEAVRKLAGWFHNHFRNNFFIELQYHKLQSEAYAMPILAKVADELNIPVVAANDAHIAVPEQAEARQILQSLRFQKWVTISEADRELFIKSEADLYETLCLILPEKTAQAAILGERKIGAMCHVEIPAETHYPRFRNEDGTYPENPGKILRKKAMEGVRRYFTKETWTSEYQDRLNYELVVIDSLGYSNYTLVVQDYINYARSIDPNGVGPGRGSGVGSLVNYLTGITSLDPIRYHLLFERYLNKDRVSNPDIDTDFSSVTREPTIEYVKRRYGADSVSCIRTKLTQGAKAAIKNCAKLRGLELYGEDADKTNKEEMSRMRALGDAIAALIPDKGGSIEGALPEIKEKFKDNEDAEMIVRRAKSVENTMVGTSVHAAGIVIGDGAPLSDYVPLLYNTNKQQWATQADMIQVEHDLKMLKFDFLGLINLDVISDCVRQIPDPVNLFHLPFEDEIFQNIFSSGNTDCVFQFESGGMKKMLRQFQPSCFEDIILLVAAYRPGPMQFIPNIIAVKNGKAKSELCILPVLEEILAPTYGYPIYQEQIMDIFHRCAGFSLGEADIIRRHMSKKHVKEFMAYKAPFISGVVKMGAKLTDAEMLWESLIGFSMYGFNKSHATAYAYIAYETAWLKYHYPCEYLCAVLNHTKTDKIPHIMGVCRSMNLPVLLPCVNRSTAEFRAVNGSIYYGLSGIKGLDRDTIQIVIEDRKEKRYTSFADFILRTGIGAGAADKLIRAGAFHMFQKQRKPLLLVLSEVQHAAARLVKREAKVKELQEAKADSKKIDRAEESLRQAKKQFDEIIVPSIPDEPDEILADEHELLGSYISMHPLDEYRNLETDRTIRKIAAFTTDRGWYAGVIGDLRYAKRKSDGADMAFFTLEDRTGSVNVCCFTDCYREYHERIAEGAVVRIYGYGKTKESEGETENELIAQKIASCRKQRTPLMITVKNETAMATLDMILPAFESDSGMPVILLKEWRKEQRLCATEHYVKREIIPKLDQLDGLNAIEVQLK